jgi:hypothetical protein
VADPRLRLRQAQAHRREHACDLVAQRRGIVAGAADHDHEVIRVADEPGQIAAPTAMLAPLPFGSERFPPAGEVLVENRERDVGEQG